MRIVFGTIMLLAAGCQAAFVTSGIPLERVVEQFMWDYTKAWNRHDSATIARDFYRTGPSLKEQTASLERGFENLRAQGYHHSDIFEVKACMTGVHEAWAAMKFSRLTEAGEPLPPKIRASSYTLKRFADGWRITKVGAGGVSADQPLVCPDV